MIIAGLDPGSIVFGIGLIEKKGSKLIYISSEDIIFPNLEFNIKMRLLIEKLTKLFKDFKIDELAIEDGFLGKNVNSMNILSKVRGVALATSLVNGMDMKFYSPRDIKASVTGNGNAGKDQVKKGVELLLNLKDSGLGFDESDALAVAICHSMKIKKNRLIK